jgi:20S proteasome alpha/beta subunit
MAGTVLAILSKEGVVMVAEKVCKLSIPDGSSEMCAYD